MPTVPTREACAAALFALVDTAVQQVTSFRTSARLLKHYQDVSADQMPALYVRQPVEHNERTREGLVGLNPKRTMKFEFFIYTAEAQDPSIVPITQLNLMADAVETALLPEPTTGKLILAGQAAWVRIDGNIEFYENVTDGKNVMIIPIVVVRP